VSIFLGDELTAIVDAITNGGVYDAKKKIMMQIGVDVLPQFPKDTTDRNRTSPFAFTGNKFEFRMVASSDSIANPNYTLNTIVAETLSQISDRLGKAEDFNSEVKAVIKEIAVNNKRIIFNGNNYSEEWVAEAEKRGLPNIKSMVEASKALVAEKNIRVFEKHNVLTQVELESRYEIMLENYIKTINIEALTMLDMAKKDILPACIRFVTDLAGSINSIKSTGIDADISAQADLLKEVSSDIAAFKKSISALEASMNKVSGMTGDAFDTAYAYRYDVFTRMSELRACGDKLETLTGAEYWPMPVYGDLLFKV
jgi:glutamine synthetase